MQYISTRNSKIKLTSAEVIAMGLSHDGGLFVPETLPVLKSNAVEALCKMTYQQRAVYIMSMFLEDYSVDELKDIATKAYNNKNFDTPDIAPVRSINENTSFLELWHGPTCAFKDMALQVLPYFLTSALIKTGEEREVCILTATSGDTGKAALEGFCDVDRTKIIVFFPKDGVSDIQKLQMTSQKGENVNVCSVVGNFDDTQTGVKYIFSDEQLREKLSENGYFLSSANSINWGRLLPQIVYYVSAYCDLINSGKISNGDKVNFCVPTGNFGNILAGYYAKSIGLPVSKLICASNSNNVLTDFINTGTYNKNRDFYTTISPSMDILVSSNLERLLFEISGHNDKLISGYMQKLNSGGTYTVADNIYKTVAADFASGFCNDEQTKNAISEVFKKYNYLIDTHTAVGYHVLQEYRKTSGDDTQAVIASTASPFKFCEAVLEALGKKYDLSGLELIDKLAEVSGVKAPLPLMSLKEQKERFTQSVEKDKMMNVVESFLIK